MTEELSGTCLVLGGAACVWSDFQDYLGPVDGVVCCNDVGAEFSGDLDAWVTLHPEKMTAWVQKRRSKGHSEPRRYVSHRMPPKARTDPTIEFETTEYKIPGQKLSGSSGLFCAKVALMDLRFEKVVFCGVPMNQEPHFFGGDPWVTGVGFRRGWLSVDPNYLRRMRSMSGWTSLLLGKPEERRDA